MKLRYLASILGALCSLLHAHAQPLPARQTTFPAHTASPVGTQLSYETPLAPLAGYLREYINVGKASDSMSADDAIVLTTDPTLGSEAYTLAVKPQRIEITGRRLRRRLQRHPGAAAAVAARSLRQGVPAARRSRLHADRRRPALRVPGHDAGRGPHMDRSGWSKALHRPAFLPRDQ